MSRVAQPLPPMNPWLWTQTLSETFAAGLDPHGLACRQRDARLARLIDAAAGASPLYRQRFGSAHGRVPVLADLEPVDKAELMHRFDEWATDRRITRAGVEDFVADEGRLGDAYLGDYLVWTSSGTSGQPGIFVQDEASLAAFDAMDLLRLQGLGLMRTPLAAWGAAQRYAFVAATGGHFAGVASVERLRRIALSLGPAVQAFTPAMQCFSVLQPLPDLLQALRRYAPTVLITYPSCADLLARAQTEGRVALDLSEVWVGGEQLSAEQRGRIGAAFGCPLRNNYGASEFYSIAWECDAGQLHLNHDWVILEPVDRQGRPVPPGETSHAVLLTNLANRTQPLLRYRLGDSVRFVPEACRCGSGFPAIEVHGRADHTLVLRDARRHEVRLLPLALMTVIEEGAQLTQFQLIATAPDRLELRLEPDVDAPAAAFRRAQRALAAYLQAQGLGNVHVVHGHAPPRRHARSGKLSRVLAA